MSWSDDCPNCGYPGRRYKGIYTPGKPCGLCGVTAVFAPSSVSLTMPSYAEAQRLAAERAAEQTYYTGPPGPQPTLEDVAVLVDLPQTGPEWDAFLRSIGVAP